MKKNKTPQYIIFTIIIVFICSYTVSQSGYYEYSMQSKKSLTEEQIKKFEEDVKAGNDVDITKYLENKENDYTNSLTRVTSKVSIKVNEYLKECIESVFSILNNLVES